MGPIRFADFLAKKSELNADEATKLLEGCQSVEYKKGEMVLRNGDVSIRSYFVERGLLRYYSVDAKGKEHILQFGPEGWFVSDRLSGYAQGDTDFYIEALEDTEVLSISEDLLYSLGESSTSINRLNSKLLQNHIRQLQGRINDLLSAPAEERYIHFVHMYPDILASVPQWMVE